MTTDQKVVGSTPTGCAILPGKALVFRSQIPSCARVAPEAARAVRSRGRIDNPPRVSYLDLMAAIATPEIRPGTVQTTDDQPKSTLEPGYLVICWNDPVNYMEYVTHVFQAVFGWQRKKASSTCCRSTIRQEHPGTREHGEGGALRAPTPEIHAARDHGARRMKLVRATKTRLLFHLGRRERACSCKSSSFIPASPRPPAAHPLGAGA